MADRQHNSLTGSELHEPKGADAASANQLYVADGSGSGSFLTMYSFGIEDWDNTLSAQALTASTWTDLNNNGLGPNTNSTYSLPGFGDTWDTTNNQFDFSSLSIGDIVDIRVDVIFTVNTNGDEVALRFDLAHGTGSEFSLEFFREEIKTAGTYQKIVSTSVYIGSAAVRDNPMKIAAFSDSAGDSVEVNGWFIKAYPRNPVFA